MSLFEDMWNDCKGIESKRDYWFFWSECETTQHALGGISFSSLFKNEKWEILGVFMKTWNG